MDLKSKILRAINKGLNEALDLDDFSEDDLKILKKSLKQSILNSNFNNTKLYYQDLIKLILDKKSYYISKEDILNCIDWCKLYNMKYNPHLDGDDFKYLIDYKIIAKYGDNVNLNWIDTSEVTDMHSLFVNNNFIGDISEWDVSNVISMNEMFDNSEFNQDISNWHINKLIYYIDNMFDNCPIKEEYKT